MRNADETFNSRVRTINLSDECKRANEHLLIKITTETEIGSDET